MNRQPEKPGPRSRARAHGEEEPGSHAGAEETARDRTIPGTASAREGYETEGGTAHGNPLEDVEKQDEDQ